MDHLREPGGRYEVLSFPHVLRHLWVYLVFVSHVLSDEVFFPGRSGQFLSAYLFDLSSELDSRECVKGNNLDSVPRLLDVLETIFRFQFSTTLTACNPLSPVTDITHSLSLQGCCLLLHKMNPANSFFGTVAEVYATQAVKTIFTKRRKISAGTHACVALQKVRSGYLTVELQRDTRRFMKEFMSCVLLTKAAKSVIGQTLSSLPCPSHWGW